MASSKTLAKEVLLRRPSGAVADQVHSSQRKLLDRYGFGPRAIRRFGRADISALLRMMRTPSFAI